MKVTHKAALEDTGKRLDIFLTEKETEWTRTQVKTWIQEGLVTINHQRAKASQKMKTDDVVEVEILEAKPLDLEAVKLDLDILYQDQDILIINKPSGLIVHPSHTVNEVTLVHGILAEVDDLEGVGDYLRPGIVHRLDKDTSGVLVIAKNKPALLHLQKALKEQKASRIYLALVDGVIPHQKGKIDAPIGRDPKKRQNMAVVKAGRASVTYFEVVERFKEHTLIECRLESGRTHQIRVHLNYIGYPIYGDPKYGYKRSISSHGQFLHAKTLGITHPKTLEYQEYSAPLPLYFEDFLNTLRKG